LANSDFTPGVVVRAIQVRLSPLIISSQIPPPESFSSKESVKEVVPPFHPANSPSSWSLPAIPVSIPFLSHPRPFSCAPLFSPRRLDSLRDVLPSSKINFFLHLGSSRANLHDRVNLFNKASFLVIFRIKIFPLFFGDHTPTYLIAPCRLRGT